MWLLQHKNIHKKHLLWAKLFSFCLFLHLIFLFWIFCVYRDNSYMLSLSVDKKLDYSTPIFFVPLGVATANIKSTTQQKPSPAKSTVKKTPAVQKITPIAVPKKPNTIANVIPKQTEEKKQPVVEQKKETPKVETKKEEIKKMAFSLTQ